MDDQRDGRCKPWRCPEGHVMGQVVRNGSGIRQLVLYREAIEALTPGPSPTGGRGELEAMEEVDVIGVVEGHVADIRCSICGRVRTWVPGEEALRKLLESAGRVIDLNGRFRSSVK